jgi:hypothetical protein
MNRKRKPRSELDLSRYDWSKATRGRFAARFAGRSKKPPIAVRILDDDLVEAFPDSESVNRALHALADAARVARRGSRKRAA